jgi:hypothetical protein
MLLSRSVLTFWMLPWRWRQQVLPKHLYIQCIPLEGSPGKCWFTFACHTCMKCGCHRRCFKYPPVCWMYTWLVAVVSKNMGPIIWRCDNARSRQSWGEMRGACLLSRHSVAVITHRTCRLSGNGGGSSNNACGLSLPHKHVLGIHITG